MTLQKHLHEKKIDIVVDLIQDRAIMLAVLEDIGSKNLAKIRIIVNNLDKNNINISTSSIGRWALMNNVEIFSVNTPYSYDDISGTTSLVMTCSESSSPNHSFSRKIVEISAKNQIPSIAIQHGFECIGLHHHPSQDSDYPWGIDIRSDFIVTWQTLGKLHSISPRTKSTIVPCGPISLYTRLCWITDPRKGIVKDGHIVKQGNKMINLLICDNSHSPRFRDPTKKKMFSDFLFKITSKENFTCTIRKHPANQRSSVGLNANIKFLEGELTPYSIKNFDIVITPPSSIAVDAALAGIPVIIWSNSHNNDAINYHPLRCIGDYEELEYTLKIFDLDALTRLSSKFISENLVNSYGGSKLMNLIEVIA